LKIADTLGDGFSNILDRVHVDGLHANRPRALDILVGVVEEENPTQWCADRRRDFREGLRLWLSDAHVRRHKDAPKILQRLGIKLCPYVHMRRIRVREGVKRNLVLERVQQRRYSQDLADVSCR